MMTNHLLMQSASPVMQTLGRDIITAQTGESHALQQDLNKVRGDP